jgi:RsiW-degrading membrane proteinase PrsW (M82 family)
MTDLDAATAQIEPSDMPVTPDVPAAPEWSDRAKRYLSIALIVGGLITGVGLLLFLDDSRMRSISSVLEGVLLMLFGLYIMPLGISTIGVALRTRKAAPDQAYVPDTIENPRKWFVVMWLAGLVASFVMKPQVASDIKPTYITSMLITSGLVISGGLWCLRWLSSKIAQEWPIGRLDAPAPIRLHWPRDWTVAWSIVGGAFSGLLALGLEVVLLMIFGSALNSLLSSVLLSSRVSSSLTGPVVILILGGFAVVAPLVEELCKALVLLVFRTSINRPIDGLMFGMAAGLGFGILESALYLIGGFNLWWIGAWVRLATILMHGTTTSMIGLAYARSRRTGQRSDLVKGYFRAVLLHGLWNGLVIGAALIVFSGQTLLGCGGLIFWLLLMSRQLPRIAIAGVETAVQDEYSAAELPMPPDWSPMDNGLAWKFAGSKPRYVERNLGETIGQSVQP